MTKKSTILITCLVLLLASSVIIYRHLKASEVDMVLSCQNELVADNPLTDKIEKHILIADFVLQKRSVSISYRYFTEHGTPIYTLQLKGDILSAYKEKDIYVLNLTQSELIRHDDTLPLPQHAKYLQAFAHRNIVKEGVHNLTIQLVKTNQDNHLALLYFLPSTNICACRLVTMN